jgi:DNA-binding MarR family transcriptional regulator
VASLIDGLTKCERACLLAMEFAKGAVRVDQLMRLTGYDQPEVEAAIESLVQKKLLLRPQGTGHA